MNSSETINLMPIVPHIATTYHVKQLLVALDELQAGFFKNQQNVMASLEREVAFPLSEALKELAIKNKVRLENTPEADIFFQKLRATIQALPLLTITIGVRPTLELIKELNRWTMINVQGFVVLDVIYDESLIAGAKIGYKGKVIDNSVKKQLEPVIRSLISSK